MELRQAKTPGTIVTASSLKVSMWDRPYAGGSRVLVGVLSTEFAIIVALASTDLGSVKYTEALVLTNSQLGWVYLDSLDKV